MKEFLEYDEHDEILEDFKDNFLTIDEINAMDAQSHLETMAQQTEDAFYWPEGSASIELIQAEKLSKDLKKEIVKLGNVSRSEIRTLVNTFYQIQGSRVKIREQIRAIEQGRSGSIKISKEDNSGGNVVLLEYVLRQFAVIEISLKASLKLIVLSRPEGRWLYEILGIGEVLAAGLLGYLDIEKAQYATNFQSFAGLNDNKRQWLGKKAYKIVDDIIGTDKKITMDHVTRIAAATQWPIEYLQRHGYNEAKKRWIKDDLKKCCARVPYNAALKTHMWKVARSFMYIQNKPGSLYGRLLAQKTADLIAENEQLKFKDYCDEKLATVNYGKNTKTYQAYTQGKLPDAQIHNRAFRWVEGIFLSHLFEEMYRVHYDKIPPRYYVFEHMEGHHNEIPPEIPFTRVTGETGEMRCAQEGVNYYTH